MRAAGGYTAFLPDPLPPDITWTPVLVRALSDADRLIGRLAGEAGRLPNPHLLIRPFVRREAVLSSRIEGTQATLGELLAAEAGGAVQRSPADLREVANYVAALEFGVKRLDTLPLSLRLTRELHAKLMAGVRGDYATPGEFRRTQNWIGAPGATLANATYVPPPPEALMDCLGAWEKFLHERSLPVLVQAALMLMYTPSTSSVRCAGATAKSGGRVNALAAEAQQSAATKMRGKGPPGTGRCYERATLPISSDGR